LTEADNERKNNKTSDNTVRKLRESLVSRFYWFGLLLFIPLLGFSTASLWRLGLHQFIVFPIVIMAALTVGGTRLIKPGLRSWLLGSLLFGCGIVDLLLFGWVSDTRLCIITSIFIVSLLINKYAGYSLWGGGIVLTSMYLVAYSVGWIRPLQSSIVHGVTLRELREWFVFAILGACIAATADFWTSQLLTFMQKQKDDRHLLLQGKKSLDVREHQLQNLMKANEKQNISLEAAAEVSRSLMSIQTLDNILRIATDSISKCFGFERVGIYLLDKSKTWLVLKAESSPEDKELMTQNYKLRVDDMNTVGWVITNKQYRIHTFAEDDESIGQGKVSPVGLTPLRTECAVPMIINEDIYGVLDIHSADPMAFDGQTVNVIRHLVSELSLLIKAAGMQDNDAIIQLLTALVLAGEKFTKAQSDFEVQDTIIDVLQRSCNPNRIVYIRKNEVSEASYVVFDKESGQISHNSKSSKTPEIQFLQNVVDFATHFKDSFWFSRKELSELNLPENLPMDQLIQEGIYTIGIDPFIVDEQVRGAVISLFDSPYEVTDVEIQLHHMVAILAAMALERITLKKQSLAITERERILSHVRQQFRSTLDPDIILRMTVKELGQMLGADSSRVHMDIKGWDTLTARRQNWGYSYDGIDVYPITDQALWQDEVDFSLPFVNDQIDLGTFDFKLPDSSELDQEDTALAEAITREAGQALESARLYTETQDALQEVGLMYRAMQGVVSSDTTDQVLHVFADNLIAPGIDRCLLLMKTGMYTTGSGEIAKVESVWEAGEQITSSMVGQEWDLGQLPALSSSVLVLNDIESSTELDNLTASALLHKDFRALMVVPLGPDEDLLGWLLIGTKQQSYVFSDREIRIYSHFADQLFQALTNIRLVQVMRNRANEEQLVREATERMREPIDMQSTLEVAADEIRRIMDFDDVVIELTLAAPDVPDEGITDILRER
jgi:GAF domain-containing protein